MPLSSDFEFDLLLLPMDSGHRRLYWHISTSQTLCSLVIFSFYLFIVFVLQPCNLILHLDRGLCRYRLCLACLGLVKLRFNGEAAGTDY